jgi:hypothetical protein
MVSHSIGEVVDSEGVDEKGPHSSKNLSTTTDDMVRDK